MAGWRHRWIRIDSVAYRFPSRHNTRCFFGLGPSVSFRRYKILAREATESPARLTQGPPRPPTEETSLGSQSPHNRCNSSCVFIFTVLSVVHTRRLRK